MTPSHPAILILGPTAGGKTALAIELARRLPGGGECISADSMQVYRGMDIGTAKAAPHEWQGVPHHLIDLVEPDDDSFSVDRWLELCREKVAEIRARAGGGGWPIIVGGTNLYVQALLGGLDDVPPPDVILRERLNAMTLEQVRAWLERIDPEAAARIHLNDRKRSIRAIEVFEQTGKRLSAMQQQWEQRSANQSPGMAMPGLSPLFIIGLEHGVEAINRRINARVKMMIERGLVEEVRCLHAAGKLGRNAREALGYKQIIEHLEGRATLEEAIEQIKIRTRRFAKQQRTWLRRFRAWEPSAWLEAEGKAPQGLTDQTLTALASATCEPTTRINDGPQVSLTPANQPRSLSRP